MSSVRLKTDVDFTLVLALAVLTIVAVVPFLIWRLLRGEHLAAAADSVVVIVAIATLIHVWRGGDGYRYGVGIAVSASATVIAQSLINAGSGIFWTYAVIVVNALLLKSQRFAVLLSGSMIFVVGLFGDHLATDFMRISFMVTSVLTMIFAWTFTTRHMLLQEQLKLMALQDPLTGLGNRRAFQNEIASMVQTLEKTGMPCGLAVIDVDKFKAINDSRGHEYGDKILRRLGALLNRKLRSTDHVFRMGGEEFVVLMPGATEEVLRTRMDQLRSAVEAGIGQSPGDVTVSIGIASWRRGDDETSWMMKADAAMYAAKRNGRNRVVVHGEQGAAQLI